MGRGHVAISVFSEAGISAMKLSVVERVFLIKNKKMWLDLSSKMLEGGVK